MTRWLRVAGFRLAALYVGVFAVSVLFLGGAFFFEARSALRQQIDARIEAESIFLRHEFQDRGLSRLLASVQSRGHGASALDYLVQRGNGEHLAGEMGGQIGIAPGWISVDVPRATEDDDRPERVRALAIDLGGGIQLAVGSDLRQIDDLEEAMVASLFGSVGFAAGLGILGGVLVSRSFLKRVDMIVRTAEAIIDGDLAQRVPVRGTGDDLDRLAITLNHMLDRIVLLMDRIRQVGSDIAHDLRTPLSRLYQRLEEARAHPGDPATAIDAALSEATELLEKFYALLRIAQIEGGSPRAGFKHVDLVALVDDVCDAYRLDAEDRGYVLTVATDPGIAVAGDRELLTQALANLIENALRHTPPGSRIDVGLRRRSEGGAIVSVEDNGPGVNEADLPHLTQRFYRAESSRTSDGNGLGLSLVMAVVDLHDARLQLEVRRPGFRVAILFRAILMPPTQKMENRHG